MFGNGNLKKKASRKQQQQQQQQQQQNYKPVSETREKKTTPLKHLIHFDFNRFSKTFHFLFSDKLRLLKSVVDNYESHVVSEILKRFF